MDETKFCTIGKSFKFDAAHHLPNYVGKCANVHGHTWHVEVEVCDFVKSNGMVLDFNELSKAVNSIISVFDHQDMNDVVKNPTCEAIADYIHTELHKILKVTAINVMVKEGEGGWART
jgi:6-pyruvoyltetrahydropterin/6-carboxytetrahydropterin synthase